jgi:hypothetical protein
MELRIHDIINWTLDSHALYSESLTLGEMVEPFIKPNLDLPPRAMVLTKEDNCSFVLCVCVCVWGKEIMWQGKIILHIISPNNLAKITY